MVVCFDDFEWGDLVVIFWCDELHLDCKNGLVVFLKG